MFFAQLRNNFEQLVQLCDYPAQGFPDCVDESAFVVILCGGLCIFDLFVVFVRRNQLLRGEINMFAFSNPFI